jgi:hypothetical protein
MKMRKKSQQQTRMMMLSWRRMTEIEIQLKKQMMMKRMKRTRMSRLA